VEDGDNEEGVKEVNDDDQHTTRVYREGMCEQSLSRHLWRENHKWTIWGLSVVFRSPYIPKVHGLCIEHSSRAINSHPMAITHVGGPCVNGVIGDITGPCVRSRGRARSISEFSTGILYVPDF
jgi:hypothetical protein